jgi:eukaryotic-like serine/threonine-protein kinase
MPSIHRMDTQRMKPEQGKRSGELIGGRYRLADLLGTGGQGEVYRAQDVREQDWVAVKVLRASPDPAARERMFREAHAMMMLLGTAAVRILDQQWAADGAMCLVMELLHGRDLDVVFDAYAAEGRQITAAEVLQWFGPVVEMLEAAHERGIAHRDLKPGNIFLLDEAHGGGVRVLDFGFAKLLRAPAITAAGMVAGTPSYLAPEAWNVAQGGAPPDHRVDLYALAAIVFRALGGRVPFPSKDFVELYGLVTKAPRPSLHALRPDLPREIDDWVQQALAADPDERFLRGRAMWGALRGALGA